MPKAAAAPKAAPRKKNTTAHTVDTSRLVAMLKRLKKLMLREPEQVILEITPDASIVEATFDRGAVRLRDGEAVRAAGEVPFRTMLAFSVLEKALAGRGEANVEMRDNLLVVTSSRYKVELNTERAPDELAFEPLEGRNSGPLRELLSEASGYLQLQDLMQNNQIDVHFEWGNGRIMATVADGFHAIYLTGAVQTEDSHRITMPLETANQLTTIGGEFAVDDSRVQAESDVGQIELSPVAPAESMVPMEAIRNLLNLPAEWQITLNCDELHRFLGNAGAVLSDPSEKLTFKVKPNGRIEVVSEGAYGVARALVEGANSAGEPPAEIVCSLNQMNEIIYKLSGLVVFTLIGENRLLKIEPKIQDRWEVIGFINLIRVG